MRALDRVFTVARAHGWPEKAVIFTESRRTQDYLAELLAAHGYAGRISLLSGRRRHARGAPGAGGGVPRPSQILLSTEAGAEGLNLQFCNLVVNYDLPWNPQRIEQRIGRCHRYGQQRDVLVVNFLNRQNAADARLYELLAKKLHLFDGVFGASDEILGALESGVDFERRVLDIYQSCRSTEEIDRAFDAAPRGPRAPHRPADDRGPLAAARALRRRGPPTAPAGGRGSGAGDGPAAPLQPRLRPAPCSDALPRRRRWPGRRERSAPLPLDGVHWLQLDAAALPPRLARLAGAEGWWFAYRFETSGLAARGAPAASGAPPRPRRLPGAAARGRGAAGPGARPRGAAAARRRRSRWRWTRSAP